VSPTPSAGGAPRPSPISSNPKTPAAGAAPDPTRKEIQARRKENQIQRKEIQMNFLPRIEDFQRVAAESERQNRLARPSRRGEPITGRRPANSARQPWRAILDLPVRFPRHEF
jgi:hypothetical protein